MYTNLRMECRRKGITRQQIASLWNVKYNTVGEKLNGKTRIYFEEAWKLQRVFFPEFRLEYLFGTDEYEEADVIQMEDENMDLAV